MDDDDVVSVVISVVISVYVPRSNVIGITSKRGRVSRSNVIGITSKRGRVSRSNVIGITSVSVGAELVRVVAVDNLWITSGTGSMNRTLDRFTPWDCITLSSMVTAPKDTNL